MSLPAISTSTPPDFEGSRHTVAVSTISRVALALLTGAVARSREAGFKGRLGLHSLPQADSFYRRIGMIDLGLDSAYQNLRYFEMTIEQARAFFEQEGER
ncbi:MAG: hypothetical protein KGM42_05675 [Hyphomicrobiales bacterium]|nr:hypothetical protein [Hyphomicrobiales bacterium]